MTDTLNNMLKARTQLIFNHPFFATLILKLKLIEGSPSGTMATDGINLWYEPDFVNNLEVDEVIGVLAHEGLHCSLHHPTRCGKRDPKKWGQAIDYVVNPLVLDAGLVLPRDGNWLYDTQYLNMTAEHVYDLLPDCDAPSLDIGGVLAPVNKKGNPLSNGEIMQLEGEWIMTTKDAVAIAKQQGKMPSKLEETIEDLKESQVPWEEELRLYMTAPAKGDYTWTRPNRKFIAQDIYLPGNYSTALGTIIWVTDSSGSVGKSEFQVFGGEFNSIIEDTQPETVWAMFCDTELHSIKEYTSDEFPIDLIQPVGRGGTQFDAPFEWVDEQGLVPACLIYLTDLYGSCTVDPPSYPVLWINTSSSKGQNDVPFGKVITIKV